MQGSKGQGSRVMPVTGGEPAAAKTHTFLQASTPDVTSIHARIWLPHPSSQHQHHRKKLAFVEFFSHIADYLTHIATSFEGVVWGWWGWGGNTGRGNFRGLVDLMWYLTIFHKWIIFTAVGILRISDIGLFPGCSYPATPLPACFKFDDNMRL